MTINIMTSINYDNQHCDITKFFIARARASDCGILIISEFVCDINKERNLEKTGVCREYRILANPYSARSMD